MDFGILNLISIEAKLNFNAFHRIFLNFTVLNSRFNKNYTKTSQTEVQNEKALSEREVHHRLSNFLVREVLLTFIQTGRQKLPERARTPERERTSRLV